MEKVLSYRIQKVISDIYFDNSTKWSGLFDVTVGAYDGAEVCELVPAYMFFLISKKYNKKDFELYLDDRLGMVKNKTGPETEKIKKNIQKIFSYSYQCNMKIVNYLHGSLNLNNFNYKPYHKSDNKVLYIQKDSNYPPSILKQIPTSIEKIIFTLSSNETIFNKSKETYQKSLENSGYGQTLKYHSPNKNVNNSKRNRKLNVIWFNPPFIVNAKTNVRNYFLNLIRKHFPLLHKFSKLFSRITIKLSNNSEPNIKTEIHKHSKNTLRKYPSTRRAKHYSKSVYQSKQTTNSTFQYKGRQDTKF